MHASALLVPVAARPQSSRMTLDLLGAFRHEPIFMAGGIAMLLVMLPLGFAALVDPREFQGVAIWLKPLKFAFALSVYLLTLAFFARFLPAAFRSGRPYRIYAASVLVAIAAELVWISGAAALGTASHFNEASAVGIGLYAVMGVLAVWLTSASAVYAWAIARNTRPALSPALREGNVVGLALTLPLTLMTAGYMSSTGSHFVGGSATDAGGLALMGWARDGGDLRVPHFFATHAMHIVPLMALLVAAFFGGRRRIVWLGAAAYASLVGFTFVQALAGQPFLPFLG